MAREVKITQLSVGQTAKLTGVSVRTLHYYDSIGLLKPGGCSPAGARFYGQEELKRLRQILFYRELDFSLKEISVLLACPRWDEAQALAHQRRLLALKKDRLEKLIRRLDDLLKGDASMDFTCFSETDYQKERDALAGEARLRWGGTAEYEESQRRAQGRTAKEELALKAEMGRLFSNFAALRGSDPQAPPAQALVAHWQAFISRHYYPCTSEILAGLGQLYTADPRFTQTIDLSGPGTADFMGRAIRAYCQGR